MRNGLQYDFEKLSYLEKTLLILAVFVLIDVKTERLTWSSIAQKVRVSFVAYICMCQRCFYKTEESGME